MDSILLIFKKDYEKDLIDFFNENCIYEFVPFYDYDLLPNGKYYVYMDDKDYEESKRSFSIIKNLGELSVWQLNILEEQPLNELNKFLEKVFKKFNGYGKDSVSDHLWTWDEIKCNKKVYNHTFFDRYGWVYLSGPYIEFCFYDINENKPYGDMIKLPDLIINDWWDGLKEMNTYIQNINRPDKGLDRWGYTLIPPESMEQFIEIIKTKTDPNFLKEYPSQIEDLIKLLKKGELENKFIIHYGV